MKQGFNKQDLNLQLMPVSEETNNETLALESMMTQSAFGHEYALMNLGDKIPFSRREEIMAELDEHKRLYFWAREQLRNKAPDRLSTLEEGIRFQKENIFGQRITLH